MIRNSISHEKAFDSGILSVKKVDPENPMIGALDTLISAGQYRNYYHAMDDLGQRFGVQFRVGPMIEINSDKIIGWSPSLVQRSNPEKEATVLELGGKGSYYLNRNAAHEYVARQHLYKIMDSKDFQEKLASISI